MGDCQAPPLPGMVEGGQCTPGYNHRTNTIEIQWNKIEIQNKYNKNILAYNRNTKQIQPKYKTNATQKFPKNIGNYIGGSPPQVPPSDSLTQSIHCILVGVDLLKTSMGGSTINEELITTGGDEYATYVDQNKHFSSPY